MRFDKSSPQILEGNEMIRVARDYYLRNLESMASLKGKGDAISLDRQKGNGRWGTVLGVGQPEGLG